MERIHSSPPGPTGEAGLIGEPGPDVAPADKEEKGAKIQPGPLGDQGPPDDDGDQGAQGECADLGCVRGWRLGGGGIPPHGPGRTPFMDESYSFYLPT